MAPIKWSFVGAGRISHDFVTTFSINTKVNFCYIVLYNIYLNFNFNAYIDLSIYQGLWLQETSKEPQKLRKSIELLANSMEVMNN